MNSLKPFIISATALLAVGFIMTFGILTSPQVQDLRHTLNVALNRNALLTACQEAPAEVKSHQVRRYTGTVAMWPEGEGRLGVDAPTRDRPFEAFLLQEPDGSTVLVIGRREGPMPGTSMDVCVVRHGIVSWFPLTGYKQRTGTRVTRSYGPAAATWRQAYWIADMPARPREEPQ